MTMFLDRIDAVPLEADNFSFEFKAWLGVLVDNLNYTITKLENLLVPTNITDASFTAMIDNSYLMAQNTVQTVILCPAIAPVGSIIEILGFNSNGWQLQPNAGQTIKVGSVNGSASVSITSANRYDTITIKCVVADTTWVTIASETTGFIIV